MSPQQSEQLIAALKSWADEKYGRRSEIGRTFGVSRQLVSDWFAGRAMPTLDVGLRIQEFLKKQQRKSGKLRQGRRKERGEN